MASFRDWNDHLAAIAQGSQLTGRYGHSVYALTREIADRVHDSSGIPHPQAQEFIRHLIVAATESSPRDLMSEHSTHLHGAMLSAFVIGFSLGQHPHPLQVPDTLPGEAA